MTIFISRSRRVRHEILSNTKQFQFTAHEQEQKRGGGGRRTHVDRLPGRTRAMPRSRAVLVVTAAAVFLLLLVAAPRAAAQMTVVDHDSWAPDHGAACTGTVEECVAASTSTTTRSKRRELGGGGSYISYDAMSRGRVPCNVRGASYYNCRPGAPANPYSRGCSAITRCRS